MALLDQGEHVAQRGLVGGVARHHLVGQRQSLGSNHQGDDHLHAIAAAVPAVAEAPGVLRILRHVALKVGAGQIIEQHFVAHAEQIGPTLAQVTKKRLFVLEQKIVAAIERIVLCTTTVHIEKVGQSGGLEPMPVQPPFRPR